MDLKQFKGLCGSWAQSSEQFAAIIDSATPVLGLYRKELAAEFEVAESTVSRWATGVAKPHPRVQRMIVASLEKRVSKMLKAQSLTMNESPDVFISGQRGARLGMRVSGK